MRIVHFRLSHKKNPDLFAINLSAPKDGGNKAGFPSIFHKKKIGLKC